MTDSESVRVFYLQQLCDPNLGENAFKTPWGQVILKNCQNDGKLLEFDTISQFKESRKQLWLMMTLKVFRFQDYAFPIFCCSQCDEMKMIENLGLYADPNDISTFQCLHSKAAGFLVKNWEEIWKIELEESDTALNVFCNEDVKNFTFQKHSKTTSFLAGIQSSGKVFLLQTVTKRQRATFSPFCSECSRQSCKHWLWYKKKDGDEHEEEFAFNHHITDPANDQGDAEEENSEREEDESPVDESDNDVDEEYIDQIDEEGSDEAESTVIGDEEPPHWREIPPIDVYQKLYGYNVTDILYPFQRDPQLQRGWIQRMNGIYALPDKFIPVWSVSNRCKHDSLFDIEEGNLGIHSKNIVVYTSIGERVFDVEVFYRKSSGDCQCVQQFDSHEHLLWHIGFGRFVDYTVLHQHLHRMRANGIGTYAEYRSLQDSLDSLGISSSLTYHDLHKAVCGFFRRLKFDETSAFSCPTHGSTPRFLNADGKNLGPTKRKVRNLTELEKHEDDHEVLPQSTFFSTRVFMSDINERNLVVQLLSGNLSMNDFCESEIRSENGRLLVNLVRALDHTDAETVPRPYKRFIENVCKPTSVRGLLQVTRHEPLLYLKLFCDGSMNLKSLEHRQELSCVMKELPVFWPMLEEICNFEKSCILPTQVADIVLKMLVVREATFVNAAVRDPNAYVDYVGRDEPRTMCYPNNPTVKHPKKYCVNNVKDKDLCEKAFLGHSHFTAGVFTAGCACKYNITLGWELMLNNESPRNLFRLLMCNQFDLENMVGVIIDHACKFDSYMLNREAKPLEYLLTLVDGSHWNSQKKFKHPGSKGKGHIGCSEGFNWNLYKRSYGSQEAVNSQSREQMHSALENLSKSMRLMNYQHFMLFLYVFFATTNIHNRGYK